MYWVLNVIFPFIDGISSQVVLTIWLTLTLLCKFLWMCLWSWFLWWGVICEFPLVGSSLCSLRDHSWDGVVALQLNAGVPDPTVWVPCEVLLSCGSLCGSGWCIGPIWVVVRLHSYMLLLPKDGMVFVLEWCLPRECSGGSRGSLPRRAWSASPWDPYKI